jgi:hypothetical protein
MEASHKKMMAWLTDTNDNREETMVCAALPLASSSGPLDRLFRARPSAILQANFRPFQTVTQATALLEVEEDGAAFLTHVMCLQDPEIQLGYPNCSGVTKYTPQGFQKTITIFNNNLEKTNIQITKIYEILAGRNQLQLVIT